MKSQNVVLMVETILQGSFGALMLATAFKFAIQDSIVNFFLFYILLR